MIIVDIPSWEKFYNKWDRASVSQNYKQLDEAITELTNDMDTVETDEIKRLSPYEETAEKLIKSGKAYATKIEKFDLFMVTSKYNHWIYLSENKVVTNNCAKNITNTMNYPSHWSIRDVINEILTQYEEI